MSPSNPPTRVLVIAMELMMTGLLGIRMERSIRGPSFCHVHRRREFGHEIHDITCGNQKWQGAPPSFKVIARVSIGVVKVG